MQFIGLELETIGNCFKVHQNVSISKLTKINVNEDFAEFRLLHVKLAWASNYRPDICCIVELLMQVTEDRL